MNATLVKPKFVKTVKTGAITGLIASIANLLFFFAVNMFWPLTIPFSVVILNSMLGLMAGSLIYFVLSRFLGPRTNLVFTIVSIAFLCVYAFAPINAMSHELAPGMGLFNIATVVTTEVMHLIAGGLAIMRLRGLMSAQV